MFVPDPVADAVERHYNANSLGEAIRAGLLASGRSLDQVAPDDLAPVDAFHIRGREATVELADWAGLEANLEVLDVGSGIGGTARYLASTHGCRVVGIDLTASYCDVARDLSALVGLSERTRFVQASALALPFADERFDVVWTEHVQMNIADKRAFYAEAVRVLRRGGRLAFHDIFRGEAGDPHFPVPWAGVAELSSLCAPEHAREVLDALDCTVLRWEETTPRSRAWFEAALERLQTYGPPPLGLHLIMGPTAREKFNNVLRNLIEGRIRTVQAVVERT